MAYCPNCEFDYEDSIAVCSDCGGALQQGSRPAAPPQEATVPEGWTCVAQARLAQNADIISGMLKSAGLECEVLNKTVAEFPLESLGARSRLEICVPNHQAEEARQLLEEAARQASPCPACGHLSAVEEAVCEYCGVPAA